MVSESLAAVVIRPASGSIGIRSRRRRGGGIAIERTVSSMLFVLLVATTTMMAVGAEEDGDFDPGTDFGGYVEDLKRREHEKAHHQYMMREHEIWRQTTWAGSAVRHIQALGEHLLPFYDAVAEAVAETNQSGERNPTEVAAYLGIRLMFILVCMVLVYIVAMILQLVIGKDYEVVEEVVIVHEHETEEEAARARAKSSRGKKQKAS
mmetsp:Transcript_17916/g.41312  ORF Transcript_17916/g.41312 Transcript_17916/m.41312 type:complete len:207 (-) Transcript_17916:345-965(-)